MFGERKRQTQTASETAAQAEPAHVKPAISMPGADMLIALFVASAFVTAMLAVWFSFTVGQPVQQSFAFPAIALGGSTTENTQVEEAMPDLGTSNAFVVSEPNTVFRLNVLVEGMKTQSWVWPEVELLDANREYLGSFGKELWHETGYDDGNWDEQDAELEVKFRIEEPGEYLLRLKATANAAPQKIRLALYQLRGSSLPFSVASILFLLIALGVNEVKRSFFWKLATGGYGKK